MLKALRVKLSAFGISIVVLTGTVIPSGTVSVSSVVLSADPRTVITVPVNTTIEIPNAESFT